MHGGFVVVVWAFGSLGGWAGGVCGLLGMVIVGWVGLFFGLGVWSDGGWGKAVGYE